MGLPIDFEEKVKQPPAVGGVGGYPYSISAKHLMQNFAYASPVIPASSSAGGLNGIEEVTKVGPGGHQTRELSCIKINEGLNDGDIAYWSESQNAWGPLEAPSAGAILYHDGTTPVWLAAPSGSVMHVLTHDGITPSWTETEECA